jgi:hypothetical protein
MVLYRAPSFSGTSSFLVSSHATSTTSTITINNILQCSKHCIHPSSPRKSQMIRQVKRGAFPYDADLSPETAVYEVIEKLNCSGFYDLSTFKIVKYIRLETSCFLWQRRCNAETKTRHKSRYNAKDQLLGQSHANSSEPNEPNSGIGC